MPKKRKTLPKEFDELIKSKDIAALKAIFDKCEIDAYGGYGKQSALGFNDNITGVRYKLNYLSLFSRIIGVKK